MDRIQYSLCYVYVCFNQVRAFSFLNQTGRHKVAHKGKASLGAPSGSAKLSWMQSIRSRPEINTQLSENWGLSSSTVPSPERTWAHIWEPRKEQWENWKRDGHYGAKESESWKPRLHPHSGASSQGHCKSLSLSGLSRIVEAFLSIIARQHLPLVSTCSGASL